MINVSDNHQGKLSGAVRRGGSLVTYRAAVPCTYEIGPYLARMKYYIIVSWPVFPNSSPRAVSFHRREPTTNPGHFSYLATLA